MKKTYDPKEVEQKWYRFWEENGFFHAEVDESKEPFCIVIPPPNITGQLHMGHALDNTYQDILVRWRRMHEGFEFSRRIALRKDDLPCRHVQKLRAIRID